jgi:hypothetical protein
MSETMTADAWTAVLFLNKQFATLKYLTSDMIAPPYKTEQNNHYDCDRRENKWQTKKKKKIRIFIHIITSDCNHIIDTRTSKLAILLTKETSDIFVVTFIMVDARPCLIAPPHNLHSYW